MGIVTRAHCHQVILERGLKLRGIKQTKCYMALGLGIRGLDVEILILVALMSVVLTLAWSRQCCIQGCEGFVFLDRGNNVGFCRQFDFDPSGVCRDGD